MWLNWERICLQCRRPGFHPCVGKIPWRRERLSTPVFWPGEFHWLYSPWGRKELDATERLSLALAREWDCQPPWQTASYCAVWQPGGLHVLLLNWAEWMRQREWLDSPHLPPPWHLVHCSSGPVISPGERTQICSKPKHSREEGGPVSITWVPRSPEMPGSSEVSVRITHHLSLQRWRADTGVLPAPGWGICEKGYWPCLFFCHPWRALSLKWPVSFQWKSKKYLEENNPIWKSVGNSVSTFSGSA